MVANTARSHRDDAVIPSVAPSFFEKQTSIGDPKRNLKLFIGSTSFPNFHNEGGWVPSFLTTAQFVFPRREIKRESAVLSGDAGSEAPLATSLRARDSVDLFRVVEDFYQHAVHRTIFRWKHDDDPTHSFYRFLGLDNHRYVTPRCMQRFWRRCTLREPI
jgi:hypothetical protein